MKKIIIKLYSIRLKRERVSKVNDQLDLLSNNYNNGVNNKKKKQEIHDQSSDAIVGPKERKAEDEG